MICKLKNSREFLTYVHDSKRANESRNKEERGRKEVNKIKSQTPPLLQLLTFLKEKIIVQKERIDQLLQSAIVAIQSC